MNTFSYDLDEDGNVLRCGYFNYSYQLNGTEPFSGFDILFWKKNVTTGEWVYLPDITPVNTDIIDVRYDWELMKAYITIADQFRSGPHEFDCDETWTTEDCETAINNKFNI